jgi:hypothetical protein
MLGWKPKFEDPKVASVRFRCLNPIAELKRRNFPVELFHQPHVPNYSGVIFSKLYDERNYRLAQELRKQGKAVIFDICDNHFYNPYHLEKFKVVREQLLKMLSIADLVVASTPTLADILVEEVKLASPPVVIGDAPEDDVISRNAQGNWRFWLSTKFARKPNFRQNGLANLLWFGIHGGENAPYGMLDLLLQKELLIEFSKRYPMQLIIVSDSRAKYEQYIKPLPIRTAYVEWGSVPFAQILEQSDINIIPISRNPFTACKTNNRLATALYAGVPTVADEIPSYRDLSPFCVLDNWGYGLKLYVENPAIGAEHVKAARAYISERYTIKQIGDSWAKHLSRFLD